MVRSLRVGFEPQIGEYTAQQPQQASQEGAHSAIGSLELAGNVGQSGQYSVAILDGGTCRLEQRPWSRTLTRSIEAVEKRASLYCGWSMRLRISDIIRSRIVEMLKMYLPAVRDAESGRRQARFSA
jgi:hypothetical protein